MNPFHLTAVFFQKMQQKRFGLGGNQRLIMSAMPIDMQKDFAEDMA
jgi:hypothetical protein